AQWCAVRPASRFYAAQPASRRQRAAETLYEGIYRPLLLFLCAAQAPVTIGQIKGWGLRGASLPAVLLDLADIVEEVRAPPWHDPADDGDGEPRHRIAHDEFSAFVAG